MVETEAGKYPVEIFKIGENGSSQGFLALKSTVSPQRKTELLDAVCPSLATEKRNKSSFPCLQASCPARESLKRQLRLELDRVKKSRLPCSLLLVKIKEIKNNGQLEGALAILEEQAPGNAHIARYGDSTFSILLPGLTIKKSVRQAKTFQKKLSPLQVTVGITVSLFKNIPEPEAVISMAENELKKAQKDSSGIAHSFQESEADSCQVTAEERSQLFSFLSAGKSAR